MRSAMSEVRGEHYEVLHTASHERFEGVLDIAKHEVAAPSASCCQHS